MRLARLFDCRQSGMAGTLRINCVERLKRCGIAGKDLRDVAVFIAAGDSDAREGCGCNVAAPQFFDPFAKRIDQARHLCRFAEIAELPRLRKFLDDRPQHGVTLDCSEPVIIRP